MLETQRLKIRQIEKVEYSDILKIYSNPNNMKFILDGKSTWTLKEIRSKWSSIKFDPKTKFGFMVVIDKETSKIIGECGFLKCSNSYKEAEIAYLIDEAFWNMGLGNEICTKLLDLGFNTIKLNSVQAEMYTDNTRSIKLIEKFGFKISKKGQTATGLKFQNYTLSKDNYNP